MADNFTYLLLTIDLNISSFHYNKSEKLYNKMFKIEFTVNHFSEYYYIMFLAAISTLLFVVLLCKVQAIQLHFYMQFAILGVTKILIFISNFDELCYE